MGELGEVALAAGRPEEAERLFEAAARAAPWSAAGRFGKARALALRDSYREAELEAAAALAIEPRNPEIYALLGSLAERPGQPRVAARHYRQALRLDPANRPAWEGLQRTAGGA